MPLTWGLIWRSKVLSFEKTQINLVFFLLIRTFAHEMKTINIAIFVSGSGTNCENLIKYFSGSERVNCALVISNKADAYALVRAERLGVKTAVVPKAQLNDANHMLPLLRDNDIHFIVLAGFLPLVPDFLIDAFLRRIVNIHPALLPKFGGKGMWGHHVHEAVKAAGETETDDIAEKEHQLEMRYFPLVVEKVLQETF